MYTVLQVIKAAELNNIPGYIINKKQITAHTKKLNIFYLYSYNLIFEGLKYLTNKNKIITIKAQNRISKPYKCSSYPY